MVDHGRRLSASGVMIDDGHWLFRFAQLELEARDRRLENRGFIRHKDGMVTISYYGVTMTYYRLLTGVGMVFCGRNKDSSPPPSPSLRRAGPPNGFQERQQRPPLPCPLDGRRNYAA